MVLLEFHYTHCSCSGCPAPALSTMLMTPSLTLPVSWRTRCLLQQIMMTSLRTQRVPRYSFSAAHPYLVHLYSLVHANSLSRDSKSERSCGSDVMLFD